MRGAILFLVAVALAAAAAFLVLLPALRERSDLRKDVATVADEPGEASPLADLRPALARSAAPLDPAGAKSRFEALAKEFAPGSGPYGEGDAVLDLPWARLPAFLRSLGEVAGILERVGVEPTADPARCRVTVVRTEELR